MIVYNLMLDDRIILPGYMSEQRISDRIHSEVSTSYVNISVSCVNISTFDVNVSDTCREFSMYLGEVSMFDKDISVTYVNISISCKNISLD
ncbi:hypothetical protein FACS1894172_03790 [Spirochaetia bacterium]|nr:hypothetical protein FACS1894172_03790 [Spirochaetia bacterium]